MQELSPFSLANIDNDEFPIKNACKKLNFLKHFSPIFEQHSDLDGSMR